MVSPIFKHLILWEISVVQHLTARSSSTAGDVYAVLMEATLQL